MENTMRPREREAPLLQTSPKSNVTNSSCCSSSSNNSNGVQAQPPLTPTPKHISRSETNTYPTTFIQADTSSFKQVVQMLTGSSETAKQASKATVDPSSQKSAFPPIKKQGFKLYERRNSMKNLKISPLMPGFAQNSGFSPRKPDLLSPSILDFPSLVLSPVTPLIPDPFNRSPPTCTTSKMNYNPSAAAEEKAIADKGFYLHPSPVSTPRDSEPRLLPLFPVTSPRVSGSS